VQASRVPLFQDDVETPPEPEQHEYGHREQRGGGKARPRAGEEIPGRAITSIRFDTNEGITDSHGIQTMLIFLMPKRSSTALLISQSMPAGSLLASW